ncbi:MAG TPA: helicase C-terminal domain-containing protein [Candidatus Eisenbacteria bacterium]|jgi:DNA polymerase-3 subunit epsilon/ATP-dependent DNA helicase DinG
MKTGSLMRDVTALLGPDGRVGAGWPHYAPRAGQIGLAGDIGRVIEQGGILLAEAPTGVGKSLAYLLPGVLHAIESGRRVVVATCTRSLQDQLFERDLPALLDVLGVRLSCARLKGKQNYLCLPTLELAEERGPEETEALEQLKRWAATDPEGDLDRFPASDPEAFRRIRPRVAADPHACTLATCRRARECFWVRARRQAASASLVVVNHALLALSGEVEGLLPEFDVLVVDEAHRLEGVLLAQLERAVSRNRFEETLRLLGSARARPGASGAPRGGLLRRLSAWAAPLLERDRSSRAGETLDDLGSRMTRCRADVERLFERLTPAGEAQELYGARARHHSAEELLGRDLEPLESVLAHCREFAGALQRLAVPLESAGGAGVELAAESLQVAQRFTLLGSDLQALVEAADREWVYWRSRERGGGAGSVTLRGSPVSAAGYARRLVLDRARSLVLTSATLRAGTDFSFLAQRLGLGEESGMPYEGRTYPSPFSLETQVASFIFEGGEEAEAVAVAVAALARATRRNLLALFTAHERLRRARERLVELLPPDIALMAQEWDGPAAQLAERFRAARGAVLLGVQSLWEGVDFPGSSLEILVVAKLPFSVPDDPRVEARAERLRERGLDPFRVDALPEAVLRFRQGIGRLIRRSDDRGVLVVCDPRLAAASYRGPFRDALPGGWRVERDPEALAEQAARFLERPVTAERRT